MKKHPIHLLLPMAFLFVSCEKEEPTTDAPANPSTPAPAAKTSKPSKPAPNPKPKVNIKKLNQDLQRALSFNQPNEALSAIEAGADPHAKNRYGLPLIFSIAQSGNGAMIKALVDKGVDPNSKIGTSFNTDGVGYSGTVDGTPLGYAAQKGNLDTMQALVAAGANVNGTGPEGTTPLMMAVDSGKFAVVEYLINQGADANAKNQHGGTALGKISMMLNPDPERQKIIELLKQRSQ